ncbi:MAG: hypothetical protein KC766_10730 [Myxococcales bacterium]|nr:hypothetical protein [Myxococcales bacterium]
MTSPNGDSTPNPDDLLRAERHAALRRLAASLSHALGTPLNVISGRAELIELDSEGLPDVLDSAQTIRRQALRISEMLKQVLAQLDHLDEDAESSSIAALLETLGPDLGQIELRVADGVADCRLRRADQARHFLAQLLRWGREIDALKGLDIGRNQQHGAEFHLHISPGVNVSDIRTALEPWIQRDPCEARESAVVLTSAQAVQLAVALGHARDAGAELELRHSLDGSTFLARWPQQA